jgi:hypothetical protein
VPEPLTARIVSQRALVYTDTVDPDEDRPPHVRAASAIAARGDTLYIVQDDTSFIACVDGEHVTSIALPRGAGGRRRFEVALGNKLEKLDLESCVIVDDELWAFGSGSLPLREHVLRVSFDGTIHVAHEHVLYERLREAIGGPINIEGVAIVDGEFWFCHRGNTSAHDAPTIVRVDHTHAIRDVRRFELGRVDGVAIGFTDACAFGDGIVFVGAAEASADAIADGRVLASVIGVIDRDGVRTSPLLIDHKPESIALRGSDHAWITVDPDDPEQPTTLYEIAVSGLNRSE